VPRSSQGARHNATTMVAAPIPNFTRIDFRTIMLPFCFNFLAG
jgi:hypothetical protein